MGRQVKRVCADFSWPMNKVWKGFIKPRSLCPTKCSSCDGLGYSEDATKVYRQWYGHIPFSPSETGSTPFTPETEGVLVKCRDKLARSADRGFYDNMFGTTGEDTVWAEAKRMCDLFNSCLCNHLSDSDVAALFASGRLQYDECPSADEVNKHYLFGMGHDSINCHVVIENRCPDYKCPVCDGDGEIFHSPEQRLAYYDEWEPTEPPVGDAWQMWENTSEGSPISPPCATPEELARWLVDNEASSFGEQTSTYENWLNMINAGWAPSAVIINGNIMSGVDCV